MYGKSKNFYFNRKRKEPKEQSEEKENKQEKEEQSSTEVKETQEVEYAVNRMIERVVVKVR